MTNYFTLHFGHPPGSRTSGWSSGCLVGIYLFIFQFVLTSEFRGNSSRSRLNKSPRGQDKALLFALLGLEKKKGKEKQDKTKTLAEDSLCSFLTL